MPFYRVEAFPVYSVGLKRQERQNERLCQGFLYSEILRGSWHEENETEKLEEMKLLIKSLDINVHFAALGASALFYNIL